MIDIDSEELNRDGVSARCGERRWSITGMKDGPIHVEVAIHKWPWCTKEVRIHGRICSGESQRIDIVARMISERSA
jgi:hypothetical protein